MAYTSFVQALPVSGQKRYSLLRHSGLSITGRHGYIGKHVEFDSIRPDLIVIENGAYITEHCKILTHHLKTSSWKTEDEWWSYGEVRICKDAFIGAGTIICNKVTIGEGAIIGAGSVVTKDVPPFEIWAGNPCRFIKSRKAVGSDAEAGRE